MQTKTTNTKLYTNQNKRQQPQMSQNNKKKSIKHILPPSRLLIWMHERNTKKLHVQGVSDQFDTVVH
jgi:hypothetical protein